MRRGRAPFPRCSGHLHPCARRRAQFTFDLNAARRAGRPSPSFEGQHQARKSPRRHAARTICLLRRWPGGLHAGLGQAWHRSTAETPSIRPMVERGDSGRRSPWFFDQSSSTGSFFAIRTAVHHVDPNLTDAAHVRFARIHPGTPRSVSCGEVPIMGAVQASMRHAAWELLQAIGALGIA